MARGTSNDVAVTPLGRPVLVMNDGDVRGPGVRLSDLAVLRQRLARGDRAGVYLDLYRLTRHEIWLMHAQITSYSGMFGGAALTANFHAKRANPTRYNVALDVFSREIVASMLQVVQRHVRGGGDGRPSVHDLRTHGDRRVWADKGMGDHFPGNILFSEIQHHGLAGLATMFSAGSAHGISAALGGAHNGKRPSEFTASAYRTVRSTNGRFVTVIDKRTNKVEVFFDRQASGGGGLVGQIDDRPLTRREYNWHERTALWEFLQANQDSEQPMNRRLLVDGGRGSLPNPNIPGVFDDSEIHERSMFWYQGAWYNRTLSGRVGSRRIQGILDRRRAEALQFRRRYGLPLEPPIPRRYETAGLWPEPRPSEVRPRI